VLLAKFGIASSFNLVYAAHRHVFPTLFASTALGYCGFFARIFSAASPVLATIDEPLPMWFFTLIAGLAAVLSLGLKAEE